MVDWVRGTVYCRSRSPGNEQVVAVRNDAISGQWLSREWITGALTADSGDTGCGKGKLQFMGLDSRMEKPDEALKQRGGTRVSHGSTHKITKKELAWWTKILKGVRQAKIWKPQSCSIWKNHLLLNYQKRRRQEMIHTKCWAFGVMRSLSFNNWYDKIHMVNRLLMISKVLKVPPVLTCWDRLAPNVPTER